MAINFGNVNISLQQFQEISSGKYNAGEVRLTSNHSLGKVNDSVHSRGKNVVPVSHAEVLAVKDAFVKALQQNGVAAVTRFARAPSSLRSPARSIHSPFRPSARPTSRPSRRTRRTRTCSMS